MADEIDLSKATDSKVTLEELAVLEQVLQSIRQIKFGYVQLTIQDSKVVQIDRTEKQRLTYK